MLWLTCLLFLLNPAGVDTDETAGGLVGYWLVEGDVLAFHPEGTGVNISGEQRVEFEWTVPEPGIAILTGDGIETEYRYVADGDDLFIGVWDRGEWITGRRTGPGAPPAQPLLDSLDSFMNAEPAPATRPAAVPRTYEPADVAGVWVGSIQMSRISIASSPVVVLLREDGAGRLVFSPDMMPLELQLDAQADTRLTGMMQAPASHPRPSSPSEAVSVQIIPEGQTALLRLTPTLSPDEEAQIILIRSDLTPSDAVRQHLAIPTTRPARR
jgi:hypothetical protein